MLDFPINPTNGQLYTSGWSSWMWDGAKWMASVPSGGVYLPMFAGSQFPLYGFLYNSTPGDPGFSTVWSGQGATRFRFKVNPGDEFTAGSIDYRGLAASALSIVGAGTTSGNRTIYLYDNVAVAGNLSIGSTTVVADGLSVVGGINSTGPNAQVSWEDRGNAASVWSWYAQGGITRLYNAGDRIWIDGSGNLSTQGIVTVGGNFVCFDDGTTSAGPFIAASPTDFAHRLGPSNGAFYFQDYGGTARLIVTSYGLTAVNGAQGSFGESLAVLRTPAVDALNWWETATASLQDARPMTNGVGGHLIFEGKWNSAGAWTPWGGIGGRKALATDGDYTANIAIWARGGTINLFSTLNGGIADGLMFRFSPTDLGPQTVYASLSPTRWRMRTAVGDEGAAGTIDYRGYSDALNIVGAGTTGLNRVVRLWDNVAVPGNIEAGGSIAATGPNSCLVVYDRAGSSYTNWLWYAYGGTVRLYNGADRLIVNSSGIVTVSSDLYVVGSNLWLAGGGVVGPRMSADQTNMAFQTGSGNGGWYWYSNPGAALMTLSNTGALYTPNSVSTQTLIASGGSNMIQFYDRSGSPTWGWYSTSSIARLWISSVGDLLAVTSTGLVGIGTTNPSAKFDLGNSINDHLIHLFADGSNFYGWGIRGGQKLDYVGTNAVWTVGHMSSAGVFTERLRVDANGYFTVSGGVFYSSWTQVSGDSVEIGHNRPSDGYSYIDWHSQAGVDFNYRAHRDAGVNGNMQFIQSGVGNVIFYMNGYDTFRLGNGGHTATGNYLTAATMTIASQGTSAPALALGDSGIGFDAGGYALLNLNGSADQTRLAQLAFIRAGIFVWQMGFATNSNIFGIWPWNYNAGGPAALTIATNGRIGIGLTSSDASPGTGEQFGATLLLNFSDVAAIGFHDAGSRVDFIRMYGGTMQLGFNGGWGEANIGMPGGGIWNNSGNVGIKTTGVNHTLEVNGTGYFSTTLEAGTGLWSYGNLSVSGYGTLNQQVVIYNSNNNGFYVANANGHYMRMYDDGQGHIEVSDGTLYLGYTNGAQVYTVGTVNCGDFFSRGNINTSGNYYQSGTYHYFAGQGGTVNAAGGGPFIYADGNWIILHLGQGNQGFAIQAAGGNTVWRVQGNGDMVQFSGWYYANSISLANGNLLYGKDTAGNNQWLITLWNDNHIYIGEYGSRPVHVRGQTISLEASVEVFLPNAGLRCASSVSCDGVYMNDRNGVAPTTWCLYPAGGYMRLWANSSGDRFNFLQSSFNPTPDAATWCGQAGSSWWAMTSYNYNTQSDIRNKRDVGDLPDCLDLLRRLSPKRFRFIERPDEDGDRSHWGFIAQDVGAVMEGRDFGGYTPHPAGDSIAYNELTALLWKAVQELLAEVETLKARIH